MKTFVFTPPDEIHSARASHPRVQHDILIIELSGGTATVEESRTGHDEEDG
jgi:hypothetical protein